MDIVRLIGFLIHYLVQIVRHIFRKWEGVVINKYTWGSEYHVIELYHDGTTMTEELRITPFWWNSVYLGDYVVKRYGFSVKKQSLSDEEARDVVRFLSQRLDGHISFKQHGRGEAEICLAATRALRGIGKPAEDVLPVLIKAAKKSDSEVRYHAIISLDRFAASANDIVPVLTEALSDKSKKVVQAARATLKRMDTPEAKEVLEEYTHKKTE